jgi:hypothetical protein
MQIEVSTPQTVSEAVARKPEKRRKLRQGVKITQNEEGMELGLARGSTETLNAIRVLAQHLNAKFGIPESEAALKEITVRSRIKIPLVPILTKNQ